MIKRQIVSPLSSLVFLPFLSGCKRLGTIGFSPSLTPQAFLDSQPWRKVHLGTMEFILNQPSSTVIVYLAGLFSIYTGYRFLSSIGGQRSRFWWGLGLILTGLGALFAGTSYQALGYEIKCSGRTFCSWTSWWEVFYMLFSLPGLSAFLAASAYSNLEGKRRTAVLYYACFSSGVYSLLLLYGAFTPVQWLVSFEFMIAFSLPVAFFLIGLHGSAYEKNKSRMDFYLRNTWILLLFIGIVYMLYLWLGVAPMLWEQGIWFSENDVLHVGLICWVFYILKRLLAHINDLDKTL